MQFSSPSPNKRPGLTRRGVLRSARNRAQSTTIDIKLLLNPEPDAELTNFVTKHYNTCASTGATKIEHSFRPYAEFSGPGILKLSTISSAANTSVAGGFDLIMRN